MDARFVANVESVFRAEELLEAFAGGQADRMAEIVLEHQEQSTDTIFALVMMTDVALKQLAKAKHQPLPLVRVAFRKWLLASHAEQ